MSKAKAEKKALPKRFYAAVEVQQNEAGFCIALDGKLLRTQGRNLLQVHAQALAAALATEWDAQLQHIDPDAMPLTRLVNIALDRAREDRAAWVDTIVGYAETDLLCYRAPQAPSSPLEGEPNSSSNLVGGLLRYPPPPTRLSGASTPPQGGELRKRQTQHFDSILDWAAGQGVLLQVTEGVMPIAQPQQSIDALRSIVARANDHEVAALAMLTPLLGSAILSLAVWKNQCSIDDALTAASLDETAQAEQWGEDAEAAAAWAAKCTEARAVAFYLQFCTETPNNS